MFWILMLLLALLFVTAALVAARARFDRKVGTEVEAILAAPAIVAASPVKHAELEELPAPVRTWLERAGIVGRERARTVRLRQRGQIRMRPGGAWLPVVAEQYFSVEEPAFVWKVKARLFGLLPISGRDKYQAGAGEMLIRLASLVPLVRASDERIAHGALLRFLAEIMWFPSAALSPRLRWSPVDDTHATVTLSHAGIDATATFTFDREGRVLALHAERYFGGGARAKRLPWAGSCSAWRVVRGVEIPAQGEVCWKLESGDFTYYRWEILDIEENQSVPYGEERNAESSAAIRSVAPEIVSGADS